MGNIYLGSDSQYNPYVLTYQVHAGYTLAMYHACTRVTLYSLVSVGTSYITGNYQVYSL